MGNSCLRRLASLALCAALTGGTALAASTVYRTITVQYSGIKLVVDGVEVKMTVKPGMKVVSAKYSGTEVKIDDQDYTLVKQSDILAIVED